MATAPATAGPTPIEPNSTRAEIPIAQLEEAFDHSIWYLLSLWPALNVACANDWGGPETADKKDWFAGAVSELLSSHPDTDQEDLEDFLLQVMTDEFDCNVEDGTEVEVAANIMGLRRRMRDERSLDAAREVKLRWTNRGQMKANIRIETVNQDVDDDEGRLDEDEDEDMEAPPLVQATAPQPKAEPEIDEDGFTKVVGKKKR